MLGEAAYQNSTYIASLHEIEENFVLALNLRNKKSRQLLLLLIWGIIIIIINLYFSSNHIDRQQDTTELGCISSNLRIY
jgi:hypothetical protein